MKNLFTNPVTRWLCSGWCLRYMTYATNNYFLPYFMLKTYPQFASQYGLFMASAFTMAGITASLFGGILNSRFGPRNNANYGRICYLSAMIAGPLITSVTLIGGNFKLALLCIMLKELIGESFSSSGMTMIQRSVPQKEYSKYVSSWQFLNYFCQGLILMFNSFVVNSLGVGRNPVNLGRFISLINFITYSGSILCWIKATKMFVKH